MKIISTIFYTVFIAVVVGIAGLLLGTMLPIPGNIEVKIVKSGSMEPAIPTGSLVIVKPAAIYNKGDIITFGKDTKTDIPTTHRIIAVNDNGSFVTKGDANEEQDPNPVSRGEVIGEVMFHIPGAGYVLDFARQPIGFALLVAIPAGLVILEELLTIFNEAKKWARKRRNDEDEHDRGTPVLSDLSSHLKRVYAKRRAMDEIKVAMYVRPARLSAAWWRWKLGFGNDSYKTSTGLTVGLVFMAMLFAGESGGTIAYFHDFESSIGNLFRAGVWDDTTPVGDPQQIVLNEFLPAPHPTANGLNFGNDASNMPLGEWIELYNMGTTSVDVNGWYMTDASGGVGNTHAIINITNIAPANTVIPPGGWLVVYLNKPSLNNTDDSIFLYTSTSSGSVLVDTVSYTTPTPDGCELEPTPTTTNASSTLSGTPGNGGQADCNQNQTPPNKSYARIPDGTGAWVDPIPTPGALNLPDPIVNSDGSIEMPIVGPVQEKDAGGATEGPTPEVAGTQDVATSTAGEADSASENVNGIDESGVGDESIDAAPDDETADAPHDETTEAGDPQEPIEEANDPPQESESAPEEGAPPAVVESEPAVDDPAPQESEADPAPTSEPAPVAE